jgi:putative transcriptional regulator
MLPIWEQAVATLPETVDVRGIRKRLRLSQERFAARFGLSVDAVRHWESGRRRPEAAARACVSRPFTPTT